MVRVVAVAVLDMYLTQISKGYTRNPTFSRESPTTVKSVFLYISGDHNWAMSTLVVKSLID